MDSKTKKTQKNKSSQSSMNSSMDKDMNRTEFAQEYNLNTDKSKKSDCNSTKTSK